MNDIIRRHVSDPMAGRAAVVARGEPLRWIHEVALLHTSDECLIWPFGKNWAGYGKIWINGRYVIASRYVCERVNGPPPTPRHQAGHSCGRGHLACISPIHLDWKTPAENCADRLTHGTLSRGERHGLSKLSEPDVREILAMKGKETQIVLAERFGVSQGAVAQIHTGRSWGWLSEIYHSEVRGDDLEVKL